MLRGSGTAAKEKQGIDSPAFKLIFVDFAPVPDRERKDHQFGIVDLADDSVITDSVSPLSFSIGSQSFAVCAWIVTTNKVFINPRFYH